MIFSPALPHELVTMATTNDLSLLLISETSIDNCLNPISPGRFNTFSTGGGADSAPPSVTLLSLTQLNQIWCADSPL